MCLCVRSTVDIMLLLSSLSFFCCRACFAINRAIFRAVAFLSCALFKKKNFGHVCMQFFFKAKRKTKKQTQSCFTKKNSATRLNYDSISTTTQLRLTHSRLKNRRLISFSKKIIQKISNNNNNNK
jgi:hypothetical protein